MRLKNTLVSPKRRNDLFCSTKVNLSNKLHKSISNGLRSNLRTFVNGNNSSRIESPTISKELCQAVYFTKENDYSNWILFEKYDGIRAVWDHKQRKFFSRYKKELHVIPDVIDSMPVNISLDGEFWFGRGTFKEAGKISSRSNFNKINWSCFKYMVYDCPTEKSKSYKERYQLLKSHLPSQHKYINVAPCVVCKGNDHAIQLAEDFVKEGAEGIILRNPDAIYKHGKSLDYVKFKVYKDDEAKIVSQVGVNLWKCVLPSGVEFEATADHVLTSVHDINVGDVISFKYTKYNHEGAPISPILYKYRNDILWDDVESKFTKKKLLKASTAKIDLGHRKPRGYWANIENRRRFFDQFAADRGFDPMVGENWYNILPKDFNIDNTTIIDSYYKNSLKDALLDLYPGIQIDPAKFEKNNWNDPTHLRKLFDRIAKEEGFDPIDPTNWYHLKTDSVISRAFNALNGYDGSLFKALSVAYPELVFDKVQFAQEKWHKSRLTCIKEPRQYFEYFASAQNFDHLVADNWYFLCGNRLQSIHNWIKKNGYSESWTDILMRTFKEVTFEKDKFVVNGRWDNVQYLKEFFNLLAEQQGFDPIKDKERWYTITKRQIIRNEESFSLLYNYNSSIKKALISAYPEIMFDETKFMYSQEDDLRDQRAFFDRLARERNMDPLDPETWRLIKRKDILSYPEGMRYMLSKVENVLKKVYPELMGNFTPQTKRYDHSHLRSCIEMAFKKLDMDTSNPEDWYRVTALQLCRFTEGRRALRSFNNSVKKMLDALYPDLKIDETKLKWFKGESWNKQENCKLFFDNFAKQRGFDPNNPENWYSIRKQQIRLTGVPTIFFIPNVNI